MWASVCTLRLDEPQHTTTLDFKSNKNNLTEMETSSSLIQEFNKRIALTF